MRALYLKTTQYFYERRRVLLAVCIFLLFISASVIIFAEKTNAAFFIPALIVAGSLLLGASAISGDIANSIRGFFLESSVSVVGAGFAILNRVIEMVNLFLENGQLTHNWVDVRNLSLQFFALGLLVIAFMNLLKIDIAKWGVNKTIPKLFIGVFFVIFSKFICFSIINLASALSETFVSQFNGNIFTPAVGFMEIVTSVANNEAAGGDRAISVGWAFVVFLFALAVFIITLCLAAILIVRSLMLFILIIVSPIAFVLWILPFTEKFFTQWWIMFIKWVFFLPICILMLCIGSSLATGVNDKGGMQIGSDMRSVGLHMERDNLENFFNKFGVLMIYFMSIPLAIYMPLKLLDGTGKYMQGMMIGKNGPNTPFSPKRVKEAWSKKQSDKAEIRSHRGFMGNITGASRFGEERDRVNKILNPTSDDTNTNDQPFPTHGPSNPPTPPPPPPPPHTPTPGSEYDLPSGGGSHGTSNSTGTGNRNPEAGDTSGGFPAGNGPHTPPGGGTPGGDTGGSSSATPTSGGRSTWAGTGGAGAGGTGAGGAIPPVA